MNMNFKLDLNSVKKFLPVLRQAQPYAFGLVLIGVFAYTAYVVNAALNVQPAPATSVSTVALPTKITFDKATIDSVKSLEVVQGDVPTGGLGTHNPFQ
jgi:hypothetical protein